MTTMPRKKTVPDQVRTAKNIRPVTLKASPAQVRAWENAAVDAGMSRQGWAMAILDAASGLSKLARHLRNVVRL